MKEITSELVLLRTLDSKASYFDLGPTFLSFSAKVEVRHIRIKLYSVDLLNMFRLVCAVETNYLMCKI